MTEEPTMRGYTIGGNRINKEDLLKGSKDWRENVEGQVVEAIGRMDIVLNWGAARKTIGKEEEDFRICSERGDSELMQPGESMHDEPLIPRGGTLRHP